MSKDSTQITQIPLKSIVPDENQPRKYFNAERIKTLKNSITQHGIVNPLIVQKMGTDKYLLVDGERRYRAATELKLDKVPAIVEEPQKETDRLVRQFNIQEQHEQWSPSEKAIAIDKLAAQMGIPLAAVCKLLNVTMNDSRRYIAFAGIIDKDTWVRNEVPLDYSTGVQSLNAAAKRISTNALEKEWTRGDAKKLEHRIVSLIKAGSIQGRNELTRLKDAFLKKPESINEFLTREKLTPMSLYLSTKAQGAHHLRNAQQNSRYVNLHGREFLKTKDVAVTPEHVIQFKAAIETLKELIALAD